MTTTFRRLILAILSFAFIILTIGCKDILDNINKDSKEVSVTLMSDGNGTAERDGAPTLYEDDIIEITAVPSVGYEFVEWEVTSGSASIDDSSAATTSVILTGDCTVRASFQAQSFTLTVKHDGDFDSVSVNFSSYPSSTTLDIGFAEWVDLGAAIIDGFTFLKWEVEGSGIQFQNGDSNSLYTKVRLTEEDATVTATAGLDVYQLTVQSGNLAQGQTTPNSTEPVEHGIDIEIAAVPASGYAFDYWDYTGTGTVNFEIDKEEAEQSINIVDGDVVLTAHFKYADIFVTVNHDGNGQNTSPSRMTIDDVHYDFGTRTVDFTKTIEVYATPSVGHYDFAGWEGDDNVTFVGGTSTSSNPARFTISGTAEVTATYELTNYYLSVNADENGSAAIEYVDGFPSIIEHSLDVTHGVVVEVEALASTHYDFDTWSFPNGTVSYVSGYNAASNPVQVKLESGDVEMTALFTETDYPLTLKAGWPFTLPNGFPGGWWPVSDINTTPDLGVTSITYGDSQILEVDDSHYILIEWTASGGATIDNSDANPTSVTLDAEGTVSAVVRDFDAPTNISGSDAFSSIRVTWTDNTDDETGFRVTITAKSFMSTGSAIQKTVGANTTEALLLTPAPPFGETTSYYILKVEAIYESGGKTWYQAGSGTFYP